MHACVDVHYRPDVTVAAALLFREYSQPKEDSSLVARGPVAAPYRSGELYRRELPHLLELFSRIRQPLESVVIDAYVWLGPERPGLGAYLFDSLGRRVPVIGVAKRAFHSRDGHALPILRGRSRRPLFVTAAGMDPHVAAAWILSMHGPGRVPTLLASTDRLARSAAVEEVGPPGFEPGTNRL